eukprot:6282051-Amphidinium_carterae.1
MPLLQRRPHVCEAETLGFTRADASADAIISALSPVLSVNCGYDATSQVKESGASGSMRKSAMLYLLGMSPHGALAHVKQLEVPRLLSSCIPNFLDCGSREEDQTAKAWSCEQVPFLLWVLFLPARHAATHDNTVKRIFGEDQATKCPLLNLASPLPTALLVVQLQPLASCTDASVLQLWRSAFQPIRLEAPT